MSGNDTNAWFTAAMESGDPEQVADGLTRLRDLLSPLQPVAAPGPEVLDAFRDGAPADVVMDYVWVLGNYRPLAPPLSPPEVVRRWTEAVLRHPDGAAALQVVLHLRHDGRPAGADVGDVISYIAGRGVRPGAAEQGAEYLARYLLDHSQTYARAVAALPSWIGEPVLGGVLRRLEAYVRPEDRAGLGFQGSARGVSAPAVADET
ncbi:hypothetical protein [Lentzea sp. NPDC060358]|uniref:hypothetical protein n=1 Tax=Lentzea sp. NPDC060358 TaxID=3347103 RepID=UPI0036554243